MMDDYFIFDHIDNNEIKFLLNLLERFNIDHMAQSYNIANYHVSEEVFFLESKTRLCKLQPNLKNYNYSIVSADFFSVRFLKSMLRKNESAWEFENLGSFRSVFKKKINLFKFETENHPLKYTYGGIIEKGKLRDGLPTKLDKLGYTLKWNDKKGLNVSTLDTPKHIRIFRKLFRLVKTVFHVFSSKFID